MNFKIMALYKGLLRDVTLYDELGSAGRGDTFKDKESALKAFDESKSYHIHAGKDISAHNITDIEKGKPTILTIVEFI